MVTWRTIEGGQPWIRIILAEDDASGLCLQHAVDMVRLEELVDPLGRLWFLVEYMSRTMERAR